MRRARRPSMYRFLAGTSYAAFALMASFAMRQLDAGFCSLHALAQLATCSVVPTIFYQGAFVVVLAGCAFSAYRCYCDFWKGEYYEDLARAGYL